MYKAVIFDFFGVFFPDVSHLWFEKHIPDHAAKLAAFDGLCTESDYGRLSRADFYQEVATLTGFPVDEVSRGIDSEIRANTELLDYVQRMKDRGFTITCLSNASHEWTLQVINDYGFGHLFDEVFLSSDIGIVKPDPGIYEFALRKLGISPSEAIFVDDRKVNTDAAEALGIKSIVFVDTTDFVHKFEEIDSIRVRMQ
jgi:epoxide hydrolase-like predicted phosphatase